MCSEGGERGSCTSQSIVVELNRLLDLLADEDLYPLPPESFGDDIKGLTRISSRVDAESSRRLRHFDKGQGYAGSGALTAQAWLRWQCNLTGGAASERVEVSRQLASLPQTAKAFSQGEISYRHAALIARTADQLGDKMESHAEDILVTAAKELDPVRLRYVTMHLRHCLQPDEVLGDANEAHERRFLYLSQTFDGIFRLDGQLDADGGAALRTVLDALMGPPAEDDHRTATQRRADAMVELVRRQLDGGQLPEVGGQKPHLMMTVDAATLSKQPGSRAAELEWAQPIPAETARRLACDSAITPIIDGQADRTSRVVPGAKKRALVARDRGCRFPSCDRPPAWTDAHHIKHWADGGANSLDNLVLLCRRHHRRVHEQGWQLVWGAERELVAIPP
jgi:Domain of unknown function (DUF222)/HNH endonuclease